MSKSSKRLDRQSLDAGSYQGLIMPAAVALACWGLAISFAFYSTDANRLLWCGFAILMGLMWSFSFWLRLRKVRRKA
ncbi:MAG: hypothetical protein E6J34_05095 [Chloroflexi bacterium]|nr:MAG: hypothetical protein E6J34_05095 [Chloroflexota bacterium]